jgi:hypothetical protein
MPSIYNGEQSPLKAAIAARNTLYLKNIYNNIDATNQYGATHTRAISDKNSPIHGKGSGQFLDIYNYGGVGGDWDKNGNQAISIGSGRDQEIILNAATWGYGPTAIAGTSYTQPNMSLNIGQVII